MRSDQQEQLNLNHWNSGQMMPGLTTLKQNTSGSPEIRVAVLDSGIDTSHPLLSHQRLQPTGHIAEHGTHICSVIAGLHPQGKQVYSGLAPNITLLPIAVYPTDSQGNLQACAQQTLAGAIHQACDADAHLINISGGDTSRFNLIPGALKDACQRAYQENRLVIAAAGNNGSDTVHTPACLPHVLAVGAANWDSQPSAFSNFGARYKENAILAPGEAIPGAGLQQLICLKSGTSFATPIVTGIAALLLSLQHDRHQIPSPHRIRTLILQSAAPACAEEQLHPDKVLAGRLNIEHLLQLFDRDQPQSLPPHFQRSPLPLHPIDHKEKTMTDNRLLPQGSSDSQGSHTPAANSTPPVAETRPQQISEAPMPSASHIHSTMPSQPGGQNTVPPINMPHSAIPTHPAHTHQADPGSVPAISHSHLPVHHSNDMAMAPAAGSTAPYTIPEGYPVHPQGMQPQSVQSLPNHHQTVHHQTAHPIPAHPQTAQSHYYAPPAMSVPSAVHPSATIQTQGQEPMQERATQHIPHLNARTTAFSSVAPSAAPMSAADPRTSKQLIYCLGSIGFDFQIEARMDYFIQRLADYHEGSLDQRMFRYLVENDEWDNAELLTWILKIDGTPTYAIKPSGAGKGDLYRLLASCLYYQLPPDNRPAIDEEFYTLQQRQIAGKHNLSLSGNKRLNVRSLRDKEEFDYRLYMEDELKLYQLGEHKGFLVDQVAVAGKVAGEVQLYNGSVVPLVEVVISGLNPWNKAALIRQQVDQATDSPSFKSYASRVNKENTSKGAPGSLQQEVHDSVDRALEKIYHEFKNNGLSDDDRAINYVGTNIMNLVDVFQDVFEVVTENGKVRTRYEFDNASVETSKVQRPTSILKDVILRFFEPGNLDKAYKCYRFTIDVSDINPVMVEGKPKIFFESSNR